MNASKAATLAFVIALAACATPYREAPRNTPHATLTFAKGYLDGVRAGGASANVYSVSDDAGCTNVRRAAFLSYDTNSEETRRVPAAAMIHLVAETKLMETRPADGADYATVLATTACRASAQFTPLPGHSYRVVHTQRRATTCVLSVVDTATSAPPSDLEMEQDFFCPGDPEASRPRLLQ